MPSAEPSGSEPRVIHLYRPQNQLGDLLLNVPALRSIRERYPLAHVTLIVGLQNADAVLGQRWADAVRVVDTRNFVGVARGGLRSLRDERPDLAVYFTTVSYSRSAGLLVRWSRARKRVGFDPGHYEERDRAGLTRAVDYPQDAPHQSDLGLMLARAAGAGARPGPPYYVPDPALCERVPESVVYLHPGAGKHKNRWPADRFAAVARELLGRGHPVSWLEGPQDVGTVDEATASLGVTLPTVRGESIPTLAARFSRAALYVGNDTGPLHLAGATGCPTVGVYGWTDPAEWRPVGRCVRSVRAADGKLESIAPRDVLDVALPLLAEERCAVG